MVSNVTNLEKLDNIYTIIGQFCLYLKRLVAAILNHKNAVKSAFKETNINYRLQGVV